MREVGYLDITDNKRLVLSISEFRGEERIDLRENYLNKEGAYNPTKKGINFTHPIAKLHLSGFIETSSTGETIFLIIIVALAIIMLI